MVYLWGPFTVPSGPFNTLCLLVTEFDRSPDTECAPQSSRNLLVGRST